MLKEKQERMISQTPWEKMDQGEKSDQLFHMPPIRWNKMVLRWVIYLVQFQHIGDTNKASSSWMIGVKVWREKL